MIRYFPTTLHLMGMRYVLAISTPEEFGLRITIEKIHNGFNLKLVKEDGDDIGFISVGKFSKQVLTLPHNKEFKALVQRQLKTSFDKIYSISSSEIEAHYQGKGLGTYLYLKALSLIPKGAWLMNDRYGSSLQAEGVWMALSKYVKEHKHFVLDEIYLYAIRGLGVKLSPKVTGILSFKEASKRFNAFQT
jgi:hypothetical protein